MKRRLITSALPYINNIPHLGNLIQVLSADCYARYSKLAGVETLYICGTDEYGTATETRAQELGVSPKQLCDTYFAIHRDCYTWFGISFDKFGRTSGEHHKRITQEIFNDLDNNGFITTNTSSQFYCENDKRFLADRYIRGTCPHCAYPSARGDQCEQCGKLLETTDLIKPECATCGSTPILKSTTHLYINLPKLSEKLEAWMKKTSAQNQWANNALQMTNSWIRDGLKERAITRDLKWGIPVPKKGFEDKVFYVWFDAPIGYISITAEKAIEAGFDWKAWWQNPDGVELVQFVGKDNIPFHTVIFPCSLLGSGKNWTMLSKISSSEYLNYESGKFSKSKGVGVFGTDARDSGICADAWRFYLFYSRPENADSTFVWNDFKDKVNQELIGNVGNLVNRVATFVQKHYDGAVPPIGETETTKALQEKSRVLIFSITASLETTSLRDALRTILNYSDLANKTFQESEPWKLIKNDPESTRALIAELCYMIRDLAIMLFPYIPEGAQKIAAFLGSSIEELSWADVGSRDKKVSNFSRVEILYRKLEDGQIEELQSKFAGQSHLPRAQDLTDASKATVVAPSAIKEKSISDKAPMPFTGTELIENFARYIDLRIAIINKVELHPDAKRLYIETIDDGIKKDRVIVSGLVPFYKAEELVGKHVILVNNLKPAAIRSVRSEGMLLAARSILAVPKDAAFGTQASQETMEICEVLSMPDAQAGTRVKLDYNIAETESKSAGSNVVTTTEEESEEHKLHATALPEIDADYFFRFPLCVKDGFAYLGESRLLAEGKPIALHKVMNGKVS